MKLFEVGLDRRRLGNGEDVRRVVSVGRVIRSLGSDCSDITSDKIYDVNFKLCALLIAAAVFICASCRSIIGAFRDEFMHSWDDVDLVERTPDNARRIWISSNGPGVVMTTDASGDRKPVYHRHAGFTEVVCSSTGLLLG